MVYALLATLAFSFYQGGYADGAYVSGTFTGQDLNGDGYITMVVDACCGTGWNREVFDYHVRFSGNSKVTAFQQDGIDHVLTLWDGADLDNAVGVVYRIGSATAAFMGSEHWSGFGNYGDQHEYWRMYYYTQDENSPLQHSTFVVKGGRFDISADDVRVRQVPEPLTFSLLALAVGLLLHYKVDRRLKP